MSQNPEQAGQSDQTAVSEGATPTGSPPARRRNRATSNVITPELQALRPASDHETQVATPRPPGARPARRPVGPPPTASRRKRQPRQPRPSFRGPRLADFIGWWRRLRSIVFLVVITVILGMILAAIVAVGVGAIVVSIQHALKSSG